MAVLWRSVDNFSESCFSFCMGTGDETQVIQLECHMLLPAESSHLSSKCSWLTILDIEL